MQELPWIFFLPMSGTQTQPYFGPGKSQKAKPTDWDSSISSLDLFPLPPQLPLSLPCKKQIVHSSYTSLHPSHQWAHREVPSTGISPPPSQNPSIDPGTRRRTAESSSLQFNRSLLDIWNHLVSQNRWRDHQRMTQATSSGDRR
jgi:hypothetical protein